MQVSKKDNKIVISFTYDPFLVEVIRQLGDRRFDVKDKVWKTPMSQLPQVIQRLAPLGFSISNELKEDYEKLQKKHRRLERIKACDFKDSEKALLAELNLPLFLFQQGGAGFMCVADSALNGDQPGLGKTIQSITAARLKKCNKILVLTFSTLKDTWHDEVTKWAPDSTSIVIKGEKKYRDKKWQTDVNYYIANYEQLLKDLPEIQKISWDAIIADEATRIANPKAKTTLAIKKINARHRWPLSGTPLNNSVQDVWSIIDFCYPGALGSYYQFVDKYCVKDTWGTIKGYKNLDKLKDEIKPFFIRRLKRDVLTQLPDKLYDNINIEFSNEELVMYDAVKKELLAELKELKMTERKGLSNMITKMLRLKQATGSLELISESTKSSKLETLKELLEVLCAGDGKVVVFTFFKEMALILMRELEEYRPLLIAGGVSQEERTANRDAFNSNNTNKVMIMTEAGAFGLNLQEKAMSVVHYDLPWSISKTEQREDRIHRIGQKGQVTVYRLLVKNTIDEYILKVLYEKQKTADLVLGDKDKLRKKKVSRALLQRLLE